MYFDREKDVAHRAEIEKEKKALADKLKKAEQKPEEKKPEERPKPPAPAPTPTAQGEAGQGGAQ